MVIAGATFAEKAGSYVNADGRLQYAEASLPPRDGALPDLDVFAVLLVAAQDRCGRVTFSRKSPRRSRRSRRLRGGNPAFGVKLGAPAVAPVAAHPFIDTWNMPRKPTV